MKLQYCPQLRQHLNCWENLITKTPADQLGEPICVCGENSAESSGFSNPDVLLLHVDCHLVGQHVNTLWNKGAKYFDLPAHSLPWRDLRLFPEGWCRWNGLCPVGCFFLPIFFFWPTCGMCESFSGSSTASRNSTTDIGTSSSPSAILFFLASLSAFRSLNYW